MGSNHTVLGERNGLRALPDEYWETKDAGAFMQKAFPFIQGFIQSRLNRDPDVAGDFFLYFYERVPVCLERYRNYREIPFTGYLASYLRHEFMNFLRYKKSRVIQEIPAAEVFGLSVPSESESATDELRCRLTARCLQGLSLPYRLPLKVYHGFDLNTAEIRFLLTTIPGTVDGEAVFCDYESRREKAREKQNRLLDRISRLNYQIQSSEDPKKAEVWRRMKHRIELLLGHSVRIYTLDELSGIFGISRTTMYRRIRYGREFVKNSKIWRNALREIRFF